MARLYDLHTASISLENRLSECVEIARHTRGHVPQMNELSTEFGRSVKSLKENRSSPQPIARLQLCVSSVSLFPKVFGS
jgi:hypothetical protein